MIMRVLVTAASKHGSTKEIADFIAAELGSAGLDVVVAEPDAVTDVAGYDAVIIGSAVYTGYWMKAATKLASRLADEWSATRVWLFSSGPVGDPLEPPGDPFSVEEVMETTGAEGHAVFPGVIDRNALGVGERAMVTALRVPDGDFRDWNQIRSWTHDIAARLTAPQTVQTA